MDTSVRSAHERGTAGVGGRRLLLTRVALAYLAVNSAFLGVWATVAPHSWFKGFPGGGHHWIAVDGPYNHHLAGDVGGLFLALCLVTTVALLTPSSTLVRLAGAAWILSGTPHLLYHLAHRHDLSSGDQIASLGGLALYVALGVMCVVAAPTQNSTQSAA